MAISKVYIDPKKIKKSGEISIYILVHIDYQSIKFNTGVSCLPVNFDAKSCRIRGNSGKVADDNLIIDTCLARLNDVFVRYRLQNIELTGDLLRNEWKNPTRRIDFHGFLKEAIEEHKPDVAHGTYKNHLAFATKIKKFKATLAFSEINPDLIDRFSRWLKTKENLDINSIHGQLRRFRAFLNIAIKKGVITENPFSKVKLKKTTTNRVNLNKDELEVLWILYNKKELSTSLQSVLRWFLFMCFTGLRISDLKAIKPGNVIGNFLVFNAFKTKNSKRDMIRVPLNRQAMKMIADEGRNGSQLFSCISDQKMNTYIKKICIDAEIHKDVSNHTGRHTFASLWMKETKNLAVLQKLLGHSDIKQTMIYVHVDDQMMIDDMNLFQNQLFTKKTPGHERTRGK